METQTHVLRTHGLVYTLFCIEYVINKTMDVLNYTM